MNNALKNMLIGLFVIVSSILIIGIILFVKPQIGDGKQTLQVRFNNINGISLGTPVTYAGQTIGEITEITQIVAAREQTVNAFGHVYPYLLTLKIDSHYNIYTTDEITVQTQGLLGEKYVAIIPKPLKTGQITHLITEHDVIYADANDLLENAMNEISTLSKKFEETLDIIMTWINKYGDTLGSAIRSADSTISEIGKTMKHFNDLGIIYDVKDAVRNFANTFAQTDQILAQLRSDGFFSDITTLFSNLKHTTTTICEGRGTLGKIIEDDGLYLQINAIMSKANTLMNDINQYGLLFQYNHQWQRNRIQMMSEANRIKDAKAFQAYMDKQIDQINITLERMSMLTDRLTTEQLADNPKFRKKFAELMQQLNSIQDNIKLYNQELSDVKYKDGCEQTP